MLVVEKLKAIMFFLAQCHLAIMTIKDIFSTVYLHYLYYSRYNFVTTLPPGDVDGYLEDGPQQPDGDDEVSQDGDGVSKVPFRVGHADTSI